MDISDLRGRLDISISIGRSNTFAEKDSLIVVLKLDGEQVAKDWLPVSDLKDALNEA